MRIGNIEIPAYLEPILPILKMAGLDPVKYANAFGRKSLAPLLLKEAAMSKLGRSGIKKRASGLIADVLGDDHLKGVVILAGPQVDATSTVQEMVDVVRLAFIERVL